MEDQSSQLKTSQGSNSSKWVTILIIIIVALIFIDLAAWGAYKYFYQKSDPEPIACTLEAKVCPDGSSVGRIAPDCEFAECPFRFSYVDGKFKNEEYGYEIELFGDEWFANLLNPAHIVFSKFLERKTQRNDEIFILYFDSISDFETLEDHVKSNPDFSDINLIEFAGKEAWEVIDSGHENAYSVLIENEGHVYIIRVIKRPESEITEFDKQILSSFKFID